MGILEGREERRRQQAQSANSSSIRCAICFRQPAATWPIRRQVGMLVVRKVVHVDQPMCSTHGAETANRFFGSTVVLGWWGVIAVFVNAYYVFVDLRTWRRYRRLGEPMPRTPVSGESAGSWERDPFGRHQLRWRSPDGWSDSVATGEFVSQDPPGWR